MYFPQKILNKLELITEMPITIVSAPMGYGKTTAVRYYLDKKKITTLWVGILNGSETDFWQGISMAFGEYSCELGKKLTELGMPKDVLLMREFLRLLRESFFTASNPVVLVIDDFHLVDIEGINDFIIVFLKNLPANLHVVICSRYFFPMEKTDMLIGYKINKIDIKQFEFDETDVKKYFNVCGIDISEDEANKLEKSSDGWISLLYLYLIEYSQTGSFTENGDIEQLLKKSIFEKLTPEYKEVVVKLSALPSFTIEQAVYILPGLDVEKILTELMERNAFILFDKNTGEYRYHNIWCKCVTKFYEKLDEEQQKKVYERAGDWYSLVGNYVYAVGYYIQTKNYEKTLDAFIKDNGDSFFYEHIDLLKKIFTQCPENILKKKHIACIIYAKKLYYFNMIDKYMYQCNEIKKNILADEDLTKDEKNELYGEYLLMVSFSKFNDMVEMIKYHKKAKELMKNPSRILVGKGIWTFGSHSVLYLFHREAGKLLDEANVLNEDMNYYSELTCGDGAGAGYQMLAEIYWNSFDIVNAEIYLHKALYTARNAHQTGILLCALGLQMKIAIYKNDYEYASYTLHSIQDEINNNNLFYFCYTIDFCEAWLNFVLGQEDKMPDFIKDGKKLYDKLMNPIVPAINYIYMENLLLRREYTKIISLYDTYFETAEKYPNILSQIYINIVMSGAYTGLEDSENALKYLRLAMKLAFPDKILMPFVLNSNYIMESLEKINKENENKEDEYINIIMSQVGRFQKIRAEIVNSNFSKAPKHSLTPREEEIARLAATGLSNKEIANKLFLTEGTIKQNMWIIFQKLSIKSRVSLVKFFED